MDDDSLVDSDLGWLSSVAELELGLEDSSFLKLCSSKHPYKLCSTKVPMEDVKLFLPYIRTQVKAYFLCGYLFDQAKYNRELEKLIIELRHAQGLHAVGQSEKIEASRKYELLSLLVFLFLSDEDMTKSKGKDPLEGLGGPMTRARARKAKEALQQVLSILFEYKPKFQGEKSKVVAIKTCLTIFLLHTGFRLLSWNLLSLILDLEPARSNPIVLLLSPSALSSSLSQTGLHFCDYNHIVEFMCVKFVSATYRLRSKKTTKGNGGKRFWKSIVVGFKPPREAIEDCFAEFPVSSRFLHPPYFDFRTLVHSSPFSCINCHFHFPSSASFVTFLNVCQQTSYSSIMKNSSSSSTQRKCAFARKCARLVKEQRARFYIMRHCVIMLICWHEYNDS
ncbi:hypothetical protein D0Y65_038976 [Glycine soja]|uniref:Uncharacterized protein n=1 Tax=Glycine soja TaxID=3848 RepID=A0A445H731_GLYSO|nr:hypothetical protein D0Y65_038976 [Glycine soja]